MREGVSSGFSSNKAKTYYGLEILATGLGFTRLS